MNRPCIKLTKTVQKRIYDFLLTKYGVLTLFLSIIFIILAFIHLSETLIEYRIEHLKSISIAINNLKKNFNAPNTVSSNNKETDDIQIDAVYTWVNGSDEKHLRNLFQIKKEINNHLINKIDDKRTQQYSRVKWTDYYEKVLNETNTERTEQVWPCFHKLCIQTNNLIVVVPKLNASDWQLFLKESKNFLNSNLNIENSSKNDLSILLNLNYKLDTIDLNRLNDLFHSLFLSKNYQLYLGFYTIDTNCNFAQNCVKDINRTYIIKRIRTTNRNLTYTPKSYAHNRELNPIIENESSSNDRLELPTDLTNKLEYKIDYVHIPPLVMDGTSSQAAEKNPKKLSEKVENLKNSPMATQLSVIKVSTNELDAYFSSFLNSDEENGKVLVFPNKKGRNITYDVYQAHIAYDLGDPLAEDFAPNRFQDNDELKYSLRSIEKYAPWIRNVFIVTNGQIPAWLNLSNSRLKIIFHEQIFENKSHLPTFSSPAIESHLHRIPGLSKKFIYFNDDYILGKPIYFDDFYTQSKGFKIHLAWSLPGCNLNCPNSWIRDGYCDKACNNTECDFDGGDCDQSKMANRNNNPYDNARLGLINQTQLVFPDFYCSQGCSTSWLADKYCDNSCKTYTCGFDMGDCGASNLYNEAYGLELNQNEYQFVKIPRKTLVFYFNLTLNNNFEVFNAQYDEIKSVRTISFVNKFKMLSVLLMQSALNNSMVEILKIELNLKNKTNTFNMTIDIELNCFETTTTTTQISTIKSHLTSLINQLETKSKYKKIDLEPIIYNDTNIDFLPQNISSIYPSNFNFSSQYLNEVYENYFSYLNWSLQNGYLTNIGFRHKLMMFFMKLKNEIQETYSNLASQMNEKNDFNSTNNALNEIIFNILFNSNQTRILNDYDRQVLIAQFLNETNTNSHFLKSLKRSKRDTFADSLRYVNKLFNQIYGFMPRKVPAHIPHLIDIDIINKLQNKFKAEFDLTSSHRLRSSNDMQFAFSYYYFIMSELEEFNASKLFDEFDINQNGYLDDIELMIINFKLSSRPFSSSSFGAASISDMFTLNSDLSIKFNDCKINLTEKNLTKGLINKQQFVSCHLLVDYLKEKLWILDTKSSNARFKYKHESVGDEDTKFVMIAGDPFEIEIKLNNLIREPQKFICLNDNIDYKIKHEANELKRLLKYFYSTLFPLNSMFETTAKSNINMSIYYKLDLNLNSTHFLNDNNYYYFILILVLLLFVIVLICLKKLFNSRKKNLKQSASNAILKIF